MKSKLHIVAAQINSVIGDLVKNTNQIIASIIDARDKLKADLIIFPEMILTGYPPEDLLFRQELPPKIAKSLKKIAKIKDIYIILGLPTFEQKSIFNSALLIHNGKIITQYHKQYLPNYGVFDEQRYFTPGTQNCIIDIYGIKLAILICEDIWHKKPLLEAKKLGAQLIININASPFDTKKQLLREKILTKRIKECNIPIVYINAVGAQDELVFDGGSLAIDQTGKITHRAGFFVEKLMPIEFKLSKNQLIPVPTNLVPKPSIVALVYQALVLGVRDYLEKNRFQTAIIGLSGGIDSALTLAIAVDAIGKERVKAIYLPSRYSSKLSTKVVQEITELLSVSCLDYSIDPIFQNFLDSLTKMCEPPLTSLTIQNIQARCRALILMAISNQEGSIVLTTGNKSELAVGYATLYGDMAGGFGVLKDIAKTLVYKLARYRNKISYVIPNSAITRPPSAELAEKQKDSDELPPYPILDKVLARYIEQGQTSAQIIAAGFSKPIVDKVIKLVDRNEFKRRQAPPGVKITTGALGKERRYPITFRFKA